MPIQGTMGNVMEYGRPAFANVTLKLAGGDGQ